MRPHPYAGKEIGAEVQRWVRRLLHNPEIVRFFVLFLAQSWRRVGVFVLSIFLIFGIEASARDQSAQPDRTLPYGPSRIETEITGRVLQVFTYRPVHCSAPAILIIFHGKDRGAAHYRDSARPLADRFCFSVFVPRFDKERFPNWAYHRGGLVAGGQLLARSDWTVSMVTPLIEWARLFEEGAKRVFLFGHSAGGQFLSRVSAYAPPKNVSRIVIANPSTHVLPDLGEAVPYGFAGLEPEGNAMLKAYLAAPVTIYLGAEDTGTKNLTVNAQANRQGKHRLDRGRREFALGRKVAADNGWIFGWRLVEAEAVGHTARGMLQAPEILEALGIAGR